MTLPSTCLPTELAAAPSDLIASCGTPTLSPGAAPSDTPFASLLTQADGSGVNGGIPSAGPGLASVEPAPSFGSAAPIAPAAYPGMCYMPAATTPPVPAGPAKTPGVYPGIYYMAQVGSQTAPAAASGVVPACGPEVLPAAVSTPPEMVGEKPQARCGPSLPKEKQKVAAKSDDVSGDAPGPVSMELVYQFVAGQWVPPSVLQVPVQEPTSGAGPLQSTVSGKEQAVAQGMPEPVISQNRTTESQNPQIANQASFPEQASAKTAAVRASTDLSPAATPVVARAAFPVPTKQLGFQQNAGQVSLDPVAVARPGSQTVSSTLQQTAKPEAVLPLAQESLGAEMASVSLADGAGTYDSSRRFTQGSLTPNQTQEKFADSIIPGRPEITARVNPSTGKEEKKSLSVDSNIVTTTQKNVGTSTANREIAMPYSAVNKSPSVDFSTTLGDGLRPNNPAETKADTLLAAHAPRLVQEIRAIADRISVIDRNSVEVRFDFSDTDRLSVRVEYRDGTVHTTFKTDSSQLRDVVAHEWQSNSSSSEQRSYRMADPVFSPTASDRQNFPGANDGSGRQRAFEEQAQHAAPTFSPAGRSAGSTTSVAATAARSARPETSQHLHVLA